MGFFSWITENTHRSIPSVYSDRDPIDVVMVAPDGRMWEEKAYEGYGDFGGKDYYELLAEINGLDSDRFKGIDVAFNPQKVGLEGKTILYPQLLEGTKSSISETTLKYLNFEQAQDDCEHQGFFYPEDDEDEDDDWIMSEDDEDEDEW